MRVVATPSYPACFTTPLLLPGVEPGRSIRRVSGPVFGPLRGGIACSGADLPARAPASTG
jgi:hypothetical protein